MKKNINIYKIYALLFVLIENITANLLIQEKCSLDDPDCLKRAAQAILPEFVKGIPELGIKKLDKLHPDDFIAKTPDLQYELSNFEVTGLNDTVIDDLSIHLPFKLMRLNFHTTLLLHSDYKVDGMFFGLPVYGNGKASVILQNLQMELVITFDIIKNEAGKDIMDIKNFFYGSDALDGVYSYLSNLFNGNKELSDRVHEIMNTNWRTVAANFGRFFTSKIATDIFESIQKFMRSQPLKDLAKY